MAGKVIAIDIDATTIRILQMRGGRVDRWASTAVVGDVDFNGAAPRPADLGAQVRRLMRASAIGGGEVVASCPGLYSMARVVTLPPLSPEELKATLADRAREAVPAENLTLRWQIMAASETGEQVLVLGVPEDSLEDRVTALKAAGVRPLAVELRATALARAVNREAAVIVNAEPSGLDLVVVANWIPQIIRTVPQPLGLPAEEQAYNASLALEQTVSFYNAHNPDAQLPPDTPLFLVGSLAEEPGFRDRVADAAAYPVEDFAPDLEFPSHLLRSHYAVTIGLAMRRLPRGRKAQQGVRPVHIDFLPQTIPAWAITPQRALAVVMLVVGLVGASFVYDPIAAVNKQTGELQRQRQLLERQVNQRRAEIGRVTQVEAAIKDLKDLVAPRRQVTEAVGFIQGNLTPGVAVQGYVVSPTEARFNASAESVEEAIEFVEALRATGRFKDIPYNRLTTEISGILKPAPAEAKAK